MLEEGKTVWTIQSTHSVYESVRPWQGELTKSGSIAPFWKICKAESDSVYAIVENKDAGKLVFETEEAASLAYLEEMKRQRKIIREKLEQIEQELAWIDFKRNP